MTASLARRRGRDARRALREPAMEQHVKDRRQKQPEERHPEHPGEHRDAHDAPHLRARAGREHERQHAHDERERGHQDRPQPHPRRLERRAHRVVRRLLHLQLPRELDDQDRVLAREPHQHEQRDLREDVVVAAGEPHPGDREQQAHRHDQDDRERQLEALVLRGQDEEHEQHAQREHEQRGVAGEDLLIGEVGPLECDPARQHLLRDTLDRPFSLARAETRRRHAVQVGRREGVVADSTVGTVAVLDAHDRAERHQVAFGVARL
jgi:hypothetical protein